MLKSIATCLRNQEKVKPVRDFPKLSFEFLHCFDTVGWVARIMSGFYNQYHSSLKVLLHKKVYEENRAETQITGKLSLKWKLSRWCDIHESSAFVYLYYTIFVV